MFVCPGNLMIRCRNTVCLCDASTTRQVVAVSLEVWCASLDGAADGTDLGGSKGIELKNIHEHRDRHALWRVLCRP